MKIEDEICNLLKGKSVSKIKRSVCGPLIGTGLYRDVYVLKQFPDYVVKIERNPSKGMFENVMEWRNYIQHHSWKFLGPWLAQCVTINKTGEVLIQRRVNWEGKRRKDYPKYIPAFFTDLKLKNFGWVGDKFVCCDYAFLVLGVPVKNKYAKWWGSLK